MKRTGGYVPPEGKRRVLGNLSPGICLPERPSTAYALVVRQNQG